MIYKLRHFLDNYFPDAFTIALLLTLFVILLGWVFQNESPIQMAVYWYEGFWGFLTFTLQMSLMLVFGSMIAKSTLVSKLLEQLIKKVNTPLKALYLTMVVTALITFINWGIGIIFGPVLTLTLKKNIPEINSAHLIAAAYSMYVIVFPISISSTTPLLVNTPGHFLEDQIGLIPFSETIFAPNAILTVVITFVVLLIFFHVIVKKETVHGQKLQSHLRNDVRKTRIKQEAVPPKTSFADQLNNSKLLSHALSFLALLAVTYILRNNARIDFNLINFVLLFIGIALYGSPKQYVHAFTDNTSVMAGILLQFPFYSGIMGMISGSGLINALIQWMTSFSTSWSFPLCVLFSSSLINFFIPANGGQWLIAGELITSTGRSLSVSMGTTINAFNFGAFSSNFLQPFWALPVLALSGLSVRDIWGYCLFAFIVFFSISAVSISILPTSW